MPKKQTNNKNKVAKIAKKVEKKIQQTMSRPRPRKTKPNKNSMVRTIASEVGGMLGSRKLGGFVGAGIERIMGHGDYISQGACSAPGPPTFAPLRASKRIQHREYIADIFSSTGFNNTNYAIQPAAVGTFPWLSQIATSFEQYKFRGLVFYLNTTSGNAVSSTNNALGAWGGVTVYDPELPALVNKRACEDYVGCTAGVPSTSILHAVECKSNSDVLERYFVSNNADSDSNELKFFNVGTFNLFTQGQQANSINLGELWVSYDVEFFNPRVNISGSTGLMDHYQISGGTIGTSTPIGTIAILPTSGSNLGSTANVTTQAIILPVTAPNTAYMILYNYYGVSSAGVNPTMTWTPVNSSSLNLFNNDTTSFFGPNIAGGTPTINKFSLGYAFTKNSILLNPAVTLTGLNFPAPNAGNTVDLFVFAIPLGLISRTKQIMRKAAEREEMIDLVKSIYGSTLPTLMPQQEEQDSLSYEFTKEVVDVSNQICMSCTGQPHKTTTLKFV